MVYKMDGYTLIIWPFREGLHILSLAIYEDFFISTMSAYIHDFYLLLSRRHMRISVQFSSVAQLCLTLCNPMNRSMPALPVHHKLPEDFDKP